MADGRHGDCRIYPAKDTGIRQGFRQFVGMCKFSKGDALEQRMRDVFLGFAHAFARIKPAVESRNRVSHIDDVVGVVGEKSQFVLVPPSLDGFVIACRLVATGL